MANKPPSFGHFLAARDNLRAIRAEYAIYYNTRLVQTRQGDLGPGMLFSTHKPLTTPQHQRCWTDTTSVQPLF